MRVNMNSYNILRRSETFYQSIILGKTAKTINMSYSTLLPFTQNDTLGISVTFILKYVFKKLQGTTNASISSNAMHALSSLIY